MFQVDDLLYFFFERNVLVLLGFALGHRILAYVALCNSKKLRFS